MIINNMIVVCRNQEESDVFLQFLENETTVRWRSGNSPINPVSSYLSKIFKKGVAFYIKDFRLTYGKLFDDKVYCADMYSDCKIIEFGDLERQYNISYNILPSESSLVEFLNR